jgi:hypothetical protein
MSRSPPTSYALIVPACSPRTRHAGVDFLSRSLKVNVGSRGFPYTLEMVVNKENIKVCINSIVF